ncbi:MAG: ABC transporter permease [Phycisphaerales bacterium]|nr:MAG: ABC transporter permease [Phycisphaerales bacterium]
MAVRAYGLATGVAEVLRYRQLLLSLTWRDIRIRYKQSMLGIGWAILLPLSMMLIFTFVFTRAVDASALLNVDMPYALFAYIGLVPWTFFSLALSGCVNSLVANRNLVTKVYFPREVFPLSCIASSFVDFVIAFSVLCGLIAYFHFSGEWSFQPRLTLLFLPLVISVQIVLMIGIGMMLAMANLFYRDVRQVFGVAIQLLMFLSNVVVPVPRHGLLGQVLAANPMVPLIGAYRDCVVHGRLPDPAGFAYATIFAFVVLISGWLCFRKASFRFAECI